MNKIAVCFLAALAALAGPAHAEVTFTYLFTGGYPLAMSDDGTVIAGNNRGDYGPFRWTQETGRVSLGRASAPVLGTSAGTPGISADGTKVASTIHSDDSTFVTAGLWTLGQGWQQLMPPGPPDAGLIDNNLADVWGLSGDGTTVVGLYWRSTGRAHASRWRSSTGTVDLGSSGNASRANGVNYDGSVIAGFDEHPVQGFRRACAWVNGQLSVLGSPDLPGEARAVNTYGNIVLGHQNDPITNMRQAAMWKRNGGTWSATQLLGYLPGTEPSYGLNTCYGASADGNVVVGYCSYGGDPFGTTGFVWTPGTGIVEVNEFLANHGILPDPSFTIQALTGVSPDGRLLLGYGQDVVAPFTTRAFMIRLDSPTDVAADPAGMRGRLLAFPNPVRSATTLQFDLPGAESGALSIYDTCGRLVRRLLEGTVAAGPHRVQWDGRDATGARVVSGIYYSRLETPSVRAISKLVVLQ